MYYYLGPYVAAVHEDIGPCWGWPTNCVGALDLTGFAAKPGLGFFALTVPMVNVDYTYLGDDLEANVGVSAKITWRQRLKLDGMDSDKVLDILWETLTVRADPTGLIRAKPIRPSTDRMLSLHLGGHGLVRSRKFSGLTDEAWTPVKKVMFSDLRRNFDISHMSELDAQAQNIVVDSKVAHRKLLWDYVRRCGVADWRDIVPADLVAAIEAEGGPLKPTTVITDDFNRANADALGQSGEGWSWTEYKGDTDILSNQAVANSASTRARADSDLSSDAHYAQADDWDGGAVLTRKDATATDTSYYFVARESSNNVQMYKVINTAFTALAVAVGSTVNNGDTVKGESSDGDVHKIYLNDVEKDSVSNSDITGNLRTGLGSQSAAVEWDNFEAGDISAPPAGNPWNAYAQQVA